MCRFFALILSFSLLLSVVACGKHADPWQEQYDLGVRYLSKGNYEEAIIAFNAAIEIDPKREEAYRGLVNVYYAMGEPEKAEEILTQIPEHEDTIMGDSQEQDIILDTTRPERVDFDDGTYSIYDYDEMGRLVCHTNYTADGKVEWVDDYEEGRRVHRTGYGANGTVSWYCDFEYDASGKLVHQKNSMADGTIECYIVYEYDVSGELVRRTLYNADGTVRRVDKE